MHSPDAPHATLVQALENLKRRAETSPEIAVVNLSEVMEGDVLLFSTDKSAYTFWVSNPANHKEGILCSGEVHGGNFVEPVQGVQIIGSTLKSGAIIEDQARENMRLKFRVPLKIPNAIGSKYETVTTAQLKRIQRLPAPPVSGS